MLNSKSLALDFTQEDAILQIFPRAPILSSQQLRWDGIHVQYHRQPKWETPETYDPHHVIVVSHFKESAKIEQTLDGFRQSRLAFQENIFTIVPENVQHQSSWDREGEFILLFLDPIRVAQIAYEAVDADDVEIVPHFVTEDPLVSTIGWLFKGELESHDIGSRLYVDSLFTTLAVNLIRRYSVRKQAIRDCTGGLSKSKLRQIIEYINDNLAENLSLQMLSSVVEMSPHYFTSLFKQSTGLTAYQYVIHRRVEKAKHLLTKKDLPLIEVMQQVGFESQSHFTQVFRKYVGTTPKNYREAKNS